MNTDDRISGIHVSLAGGGRIAGRVLFKVADPRGGSPVFENALETI